LAPAAAVDEDHVCYKKKRMSSKKNITNPYYLIIARTIFILKEYSRLAKTYSRNS